MTKSFAGRWRALAVLLLAAALWLTWGEAQAAENPVLTPVYVNGEQILMHDLCVAREGTLYAIGEDLFWYLGADTEWNQQSQSLVISNFDRAGSQLVLTPNSRQAQLLSGGQTSQLLMEQPTFWYKDSLAVPLGFVAGQLGYQLTYEQGAALLTGQGEVLDGRQVGQLQLDSEQFSENLFSTQQRRVVGAVVDLISQSRRQPVDPASLPELTKEGWQYSLMGDGENTRTVWQFYTAAGGGLYLHEELQDCWYAADPQAYQQYYQVAQAYCSAPWPDFTTVYKMGERVSGRQLYNILNEARHDYADLTVSGRLYSYVYTGQGFRPYAANYLLLHEGKIVGLVNGSGYASFSQQNSLLAQLQNYANADTPFVLVYDQSCTYLFDGSSWRLLQQRKDSHLIDKSLPLLEVDQPVDTSQLQVTAPSQLPGRLDIANVYNAWRELQAQAAAKEE